MCFFRCNRQSSLRRQRKDSSLTSPSTASHRPNHRHTVSTAGTMKSKEVSDNKSAEALTEHAELEAHIVLGRVQVHKHLAVSLQYQTHLYLSLKPHNGLLY